MKKFILGLCLLLIAGASTAQENSISITSGGHDGSGGNALGSGHPNAEHLISLLQRSKQPVSFVLRRLEFLLSVMKTDPLYESMNAKLFTGPHTIYNALMEADFKPVAHGPCYDKDETGAVVERDGSSKAAPQICFSLERLTKLNEDSVQSEILALVVHEVSHMVGTTETEAVLLQVMVKYAVPGRPFENIAAKVKNYQNQLDDAVNSASEIYRARAAPGIICSGGPAFFTQLSWLLQANMNAIGQSDAPMDGILFSRPREVRLLGELAIRTTNILTLCFPSVAAYKKIHDSFGGETELSIDEFYKRANPEDKHPSHNEGVIHRIDNDHDGALQVELSLIVTTMENIRDRFLTSEDP